MIRRCGWVSDDLDYIKYHDEEWGRPVTNDAVLFEFLILEGAQAGLSWVTILKRREGYREVFHGFDVNKVAKMTDGEIENALKNSGIIRNKLKVLSAVNNARVFSNIQKEFGNFSNYIWAFVGNKPIKNNYKSSEELLTTSAESEAISKDLKKRGMSFVGSTIIYAYMQATGLLNDHENYCFLHG